MQRLTMVNIVFVGYCDVLLRFCLNNLLKNYHKCTLYWNISGMTFRCRDNSSRAIESIRITLHLDSLSECET